MHYVLRVQGHLDPSWSDRFGGLRTDPESRRQAPPCSLDRCQIRPRCMVCSYRSFGSAWCCFRLRRARRKVREQAADRRPAESLDAESRGQIE